MRRWLVLACLAAVPLVLWRAVEVAGEMRRDRRAAAAYARGTELQVERRYDEAAAAFREAITISPRATAAYEALGGVEFRRGRYDEAIAAYRRLMAQYPYTYLSELHRQVGLIELRDGRFHDAVRDLRQAVDLDPRDWLALYWLGHAYERLGDRESARTMWRRVAALNPDFAPVHVQLERLDEQRP